MKLLTVVALLFFAFISLVSVGAQTPTDLPTRSPTRSPTRKPTRKPTFSPTRAKGIYGDKGPPTHLPFDQQQIIVGIMIAFVILGMAFEITTPEILFLIALIIVILTEVISLTDGLSGFSNTALITIGTLFLVIGAVEKSHIVDWFARQAFGAKGNLFIAKLRVYFTAFSLSIFFNNTPLVALLIPILKDWAKLRGLAASQVLIPLSYSVLAGSFGSMIGTSTNLTIQGLMIKDRNYAFDFFAPLPIGAVAVVILNFYMALTGWYLLPRDRNGEMEDGKDRADEHVIELYVAPSANVIGLSIADTLISWGIAPSHAVKIRRNRNSVEVEPKKPFFKRLTSGGVSAPSIAWTPNPIKSISTKSLDGTEYDATNADYYDIEQPNPDELIRGGDIIYVSSAQDVVEKLLKSILGEAKGIYALKTSVLTYPSVGYEFVELVVSDTSPLVGAKVADVPDKFNESYKAALVTVRGKNWTLSRGDSGDIETVYSEGDPSGLVAADSIEGKQILGKRDISSHILQSGDTVLAVTSTKNVSALRRNRDFFVVSNKGEVPKPLSFYSGIPLLVFAGVLITAATESIDICPGALAATAFFFMGGWLNYKDIDRYVDLRLLMLLGTSISFAVSMTKSGLAAKIAAEIDKTDPTPTTAVALVYLITLALTELVSNNAAAALMYPIAVGLADQLKVNYKGFAMAVLVASTAGFVSPIGYQTHLMVWAPGGYRFRDFVIFGIIPDIIYFGVTVLLIPGLFPYDDYTPK